MSRILALRMTHAGNDICEVCFVKNSVYKRRDTMGSVGKACIDCCSKAINSDIEKGIFGKLNLKGQEIEVSHVVPGSRPGELLLYERIKVKS